LEGGNHHTRDGREEKWFRDSWNCLHFSLGLNPSFLVVGFAWLFAGSYADPLFLLLQTPLSLLLLLFSPPSSLARCLSRSLPDLNMSETTKLPTNPLSEIEKKFFNAVKIDNSSDPAAAALNLQIFFDALAKVERKKWAYAIENVR
jgi:hypothetical protein